VRNGVQEEHAGEIDSGNTIGNVGLGFTHRHDAVDPRCQAVQWRRGLLFPFRRSVDVRRDGNPSVFYGKESTRGFDIQIRFAICQTAVWIRWPVQK